MYISIGATEDNGVATGSLGNLCLDVKDSQVRTNSQRHLLVWCCTRWLSTFVFCGRCCTLLTRFASWTAQPNVLVSVWCQYMVFSTTWNVRPHLRQTHYTIVGHASREVNLTFQKHSPVALACARVCAPSRALVPFLSVPVRDSRRV